MPAADVVPVPIGEACRALSVVIPQHLRRRRPSSRLAGKSSSLLKAVTMECGGGRNSANESRRVGDWRVRVSASDSRCRRRMDATTSRATRPNSPARLRFLWPAPFSHFFAALFSPLVDALASIHNNNRCPALRTDTDRTKNKRNESALRWPASQSAFPAPHPHYLLPTTHTHTYTHTRIRTQTDTHTHTTGPRQTQ